MRSTRLLPILFALVPALGCGDDIKFPDPTELPDPALNGVFPAKAFTDRTLRVQISGDATEFTGTPTVSFGADITVVSVELSSPSTLFANISIAGAAAVGKRDVTVTNGAEALTLTAAFDVQNPLEIITDGPVLQGGLNQVLIINHDPENPFLGTLEVTGGSGVAIFIDDASQTESIAQGTVFVDTNAVSGPLVVNDILLDTTVSRGPSLEVTPRTPTALTAPGKGPSFQVLGASLTNTTALFSFQSESAIWRGTTSIADPDGIAPLLIWLPGGKWANARAFNTDDLIPVTDGSVMNVVVFDGFATGTVFDLAVDEFHALPGAVALAEVEDNDFFVDGPQVLPDNQDVTLFTGLLNADDTGFDDIQVTLEAGDQIHVTTTRGAGGNADTAVYVFDDQDFITVDGNGTETDPFCLNFGSCFTGTSDFVGFAASDDINEATFLFASDTTSVPLPAGTYVIEVVSSVFGNDDDYEMGISIIHNAQ